MTDFFISYSRDDAAWATWIAAQLERAGYTTIIDLWDFPAGSNFVLQMDQAVRSASRTLAVLSPSYLGALYTHPEWAAAFARDPGGVQQTLVPIRVRHVELSGLLAQLVFIDLVGKSEAAARDALLAGLTLTRERTSVDFPSEKPRLPGIRRHYPGSTSREHGGEHSLDAAVDLAMAGQIASAVDALESLARREPGRALVHYNLGVLHDGLGNVADAIREYRRAVSLGDEFGDSLCNLGHIYLRAGDCASAQSAFEAALKVNSLHLGALAGLGSIAVAEGQFDVASGRFTEILSVDPHNITARNNLADALLRLNRPHDAMVEIRKARLANPAHEASQRTEREVDEAPE